MDTETKEMNTRMLEVVPEIKKVVFQLLLKDNP